MYLVDIPFSLHFSLLKITLPQTCLWLNFYLFNRLVMWPPWTTWLFFICSITAFCDPWNTACQASLSFTISQSLLKLVFIESVMPSNHFIFCHSLLLSSNFPSIRVFSSEYALRIRWPNYWSFSISPSNEYSGLISFRFD